MKRTRPQSAEPTQPTERKDSPPEKRSCEPGADVRQTNLPHPPAAPSTPDSLAKDPVPLGLSIVEPSKADPLPTETHATPPSPGLSPSAPGKPSIPPILLEGDESRTPLAEGPDQRFAPRPQDEPPANFPASQPSECTDRLLLVARDPGCLYAHWDVNRQRPEEDPNAQELTLRIHKDALSGPVIAEQRVGPGSDHAFVPVASNGGKYVAQLGHYPAGKPWESVVVSDPVATPFVPARESGPVKFATLQFPIPGPAEIPVAFSNQATLNSARAANTPTLISGTEKAPESVLPQEFPLVMRSGAPPTDLSELESSADLELHPDQDMFGAPWTPPSEETTAEQWTPAQERALAELIGWSVLRHRRVASEDLVSMLHGEGELTRVLAEGKVLAVPALSSESVGSVPLEPPGFWLNVNAELVIYGATDPRSQLTLGGKQIQLRPDGTFSYRFALPDGTYHLPIEAVSLTGDRRAAELVFFRGSVYSGQVGKHPQSAELAPPNSKVSG